MQSFKFKTEILLILLFFKGLLIFSQIDSDISLVSDTNKVIDSVENRGVDVFPDYIVDSAIAAKDTMIVDSIETKGDTATLDTTTKNKDESLDIPVDYVADDSIIVNVRTKTVYLYKNAKVVYGEQVITADYIEFDMKNNNFYASALPGASREDDLSKFPVFEDGSQKFEADVIKYNFKSKKGLIEQVYTEQGEGYLHGEKIKRHTNEHIHIKNGKYTTCDMKHPHFYLALTKAEIIPDDKIVSGPVYMVVGDIPIYPLFLPFGFFPSTKTAKSGILIPDYGEDAQRGYFLKDGGFYWAINEYMDLKTLGSYYSNGTWGVGAEARYRFRYKFNGNLDFDFFREKFEVDNGLDMSYRQDMRLYWTHNQDPKANPYNRFSANVRFSTTEYDENYTYDSRYLNNTQSSNISYSRSWPGGSPFSLSANIRQSQNKSTGNHNFKLPDLTFNVSQINPFQSDTRTDKKWFDNIQLSYSSRFSNTIDVKDSLLFDNRGWESDSFDYGFSHRIPLSFVFKPLSFSEAPKTTAGKIVRNVVKPFNTLTITPSFNYEGVFYNSIVNKDYIVETDSANGEQSSKLIEQKVDGFRYGQVFYPRISAGMAPKLYGMYMSKNENFPIQALRHVITASANFSYTPDFSEYNQDYFDTVYDPLSTTGGYTRYSVFENGMYGTPTSPRESGVISLGLRNNLEMKVREQTDSTENLRKVSLLDRFDFSTSYDMFADSLNWSNISFNSSTKLFKKSLDVRVKATFDPYAWIENPDTNRDNYVKIDKSLYKDQGKLANMSNLTLGLSYRINNKTIVDIFGSDIEEEKKARKEYDPYDYYNVKWSLSFSYDFTRRKPTVFDSATTVQTVRISGSLSPTDTWSVNASTGYDFTSKKMSYTTMTVSKDLHCFSARLTFSPFGNHKYYMFSIGAKSSMLSDLKYEKRDNWRNLQ